MLACWTCFHRVWSGPTLEEINLGNSEKGLPEQAYMCGKCGKSGVSADGELSETCMYCGADDMDFVLKDTKKGREEK